MSIFAATVLGDVLLFLILEGSQTAPGPTGDTLGGCETLFVPKSHAGECGNPSSHPLHFQYSGETLERHIIQNKSKTLKSGEGAENVFCRQTVGSFNAKTFRKKRNPGGAHPQYCLSETAFSEAEPSPPKTEAPLLHCNDLQEST